MEEQAAKIAETQRQKEMEKYQEGIRYQQELERQLEVRRIERQHTKKKTRKKKFLPVKLNQNPSTSFVK